MADKIHCIRKTLRLMPQEAEMLAKKAGESGMCEADYLRLLISQKPNDYPEVRELLKELINEVNRIGINIHQKLPCICRYGVQESKPPGCDGNSN